MNRRQFGALFLCSLISWWVGSALMPLLPIYTAQLGASPAMVGNYLSFVFLSLAIGTAGTGWLSTKLPRPRDLLLLLGLLAALATWSMGQVTVLWQLLLLNATVWFAGGATLALVAIVVGLNAAAEERGRIFGLLGITTALGGVLGGLAGPIADRWGYTALFTVAACAWLVQVGAAAFLPNGQRPSDGGTPALRQRPVGRRETKPAGRRWAELGPGFLLLLLAGLLFASGSFVATLGRSLAMDRQGFAVTAITLAAAAGSASGMVFNPLLGRLSDRVNRQLLLCLIYAAGLLALVMMAVATSMAGFLAVSALMALGGVERAVSSALVADLLPPHALNQGLSLFDAAKWVGGAAGLAGTGYAVQLLGLQPALLLGALLPVLAIVLLAGLRRAGSGAIVPAPSR